MKTGTTSLQRALAQRRSRLLRRGVHYPGSAYNHRRQIGAFLGLRVNKRNRLGPVGQGTPKSNGDPSIPPMEEWFAMLDEIEAERHRRTVISHELVSEATDTQAMALVEQLGGSTHIVITLRSLASVLPSFWTQLLKSALAESLDDWLSRALEANHERPIPARQKRGLNHPELINRWVRIVGPDRVTVVITDRNRPELLPRAFEHILELPRGLLSSTPSNGLRANRSLTQPEAQILLHVNQLCRENEISWNSYMSLVQRGIVKNLLRARQPGLQEGRIQLPQWASEHCRIQGQITADTIETNRIHVIGDLAALYAQPTQTQENAQPPQEPSVELAAEALIGLLTAAAIHNPSGVDANTDYETKLKHDVPTINDYSTPDMLNAIRIRLTHKVLKQQSKPIRRSTRS